MMRWNGRAWARVAGSTLCATLLVAGTACGTRASSDNAASDAPAPATPSSPNGQTTTGAAPAGSAESTAPAAVPEAGSTPNGSAAASPASSGSTPASAKGAPAAGNAGSAGSAASGGGSGSTPATGAKSATGRAGAGPGTAGSGTPGAAPTPGTPGTPAPGGNAPTNGARSPVILATVGTQSGPAASTTYAITQGGQIWVKYINTKGGLNGHEVKLIVYDDGGDPARHRAQVQEAIEKRGAMAFLASADAIAGRGSVEYINQKKVPHIGTMGGINWAYESPMFFPQSSDGTPQYVSWVASMANQLKGSGKQNLGVLVCVEAPTCTDAGKTIADTAPKLGYKVVYQAKSSIAQPDFTAECLAARNAGSEVFMVIMDSNSASRVVSSCARQSFKPVLATGAAIVVDRFKDDPNFEGLVASTNVFPWFQTGTPNTDEYQAAMKAFGGGAVSGVGTTTGWKAGKLLERAGRQLPEPPSALAILQGLWSIKGDDLGGLTYPITFTENQPAQPQTCWFNLNIRKAKWVSPDGYQRVCQ